MKTVIIIDDSLLIRLMLQKFFTKEMGLNVTAMGSDGNDAVKLYKKYTPDLVILDLNMPAKNGIIAYKEILDEFPNAKIVICSTIKAPSVIIDSLNYGVLTYIKKPLLFYDYEFVNNFKIDIHETLNYSLENLRS